MASTASCEIERTSTGRVFAGLDLFEGEQHQHRAGASQNQIQERIR